MAHGWNSCFHDCPPLTSDPGTQRTAELDQAFPQPPDNISGQNILPEISNSQGALLPNSSFITNGSTKVNADNSSADCAYQNYCNKLEWQTDGKYSEKESSQRCESNAISCFASDSVPALEPFGPDLLSTADLGSYSDVRSCSDRDASEARPSCKLMEGELFLSKKKECLSTSSSLACFFRKSGNIPFLTDGQCGDISETNGNLLSQLGEGNGELSCAQEKMKSSKKTITLGPNLPSTTSSMPASIINATIHEAKKDFLDQKRKRELEKSSQEDCHPGMSTREKLAKDGIKHYLPDEKNRIISAALSTFDYDQEDNVKVPVQIHDFRNPDSTDIQDSYLSEDVEETIDLLNRKKDQPDSEELKSPAPNSTNSLIDTDETSRKEKQIWTNDFQSHDTSVKEDQSSKIVGHKQSKCTYVDNSLGAESSLQLFKQQPSECEAKDDTCKYPPEMTDESIATILSGASLQRNDDVVSAVPDSYSNESNSSLKDANDKSLMESDNLATGTNSTMQGQLMRKSKILMNSQLSDYNGITFDKIAKVTISRRDSDADDRTNSCKQSILSSSNIQNCTPVKIIPFEEASTFSKERDSCHPENDCGSLFHIGDLKNKKVENLLIPLSDPQSSGSDKHPILADNNNIKIPLNPNHSDPLTKCEHISSNASHDENVSDAVKPDSCPQPNNLDTGVGMQGAKRSTANSPVNPELGEDLIPVCTSSTKLDSFLREEWMRSMENANATPDQYLELHESLKEQKVPCSFGDIFEHAKESSDLDSLTLDQSPPDPLYGEPLSRDDSCDSDEMNLDSREYEPLVTRFEKDSMDYPDAGPSLKFSFQMKELFHPVVVMNYLESTKGSFYQCKACQFTAQNVDHLIEHHYCCQPMRNFQFCPTCNVYLLNNEGKKHFCGATKENPILSNLEPVKKKFRGRHKCKKCKLVFSKILLYVKHMRTHTGKTPYKCNQCGLYFAQPSSLGRHKKVVLRCKGSQVPVSSPDAIVVKTEPSLQPEDFAQQGVTQSLLHESIKECYVKLVDVFKKTLCHICGKSFASKKQVKKHIYKVHSKNKIPAASSRPSKNESSKQIVEGKIEAQEQYKCPLCPRLFKYSYNRARHLRDCVRKVIYGGKVRVGGKYACPLCSATFTATSNRYRHIKNSCIRDSLNKLVQERIKSKNENTLLNTVEKEQKPEQKDIVRNPQPQVHIPKLQMDDVSKNRARKHVPRYKCNHCPAVFSHSSGKYRHMKKHELFKLTGKTFKYRNSILSFISKPKPESTSSTKSDACTEQFEETVQAALSCQFCGKTFDTLADLKKHEHGHHGERPYRCLECAKVFRKRPHLLNHKLTHQRSAQCIVCKKILPSFKELLRHRRNNHKKALIKCPECPAEFQFPVYLRRHLVRHASKSKTEQPGKLPTTQEQFLDTDEDQNESNKAQCSLCQEVFDNQHKLRKHCLTHISGPRPNQCPFCVRKFKNRRYLLRHIVKHTGEKCFSCTNCGKQFYKITFLKAHHQKCVPPPSLVSEEPTTRNIAPYDCSICPRKFTKKDRWQSHLAAHKKNSLHFCSKCGQYFGFNAIARHRAECEKDAKPPAVTKLTSCDWKETPLQVCQTENKKPLQSKSTSLIQFKCPDCPQKFRYKSLYLRHLTSHTGVQPYACVHCGRRFSSETMCVNHEASCDGVDKDNQSIFKSEAATKMDSLREEAKKILKTGEDEYKCKFCTKTFTKARNLRNHILTHNEVKPYRCKACDSCFSRYDHLKVHQSRCKMKKTRLEVRIPKISLDDIGKGWQSKLDVSFPQKEDTFDCEKCSRSFPAQSKLSRHITMFHTIKKFKCTKCGAAFSHEKTLKQHRKMKKCRRQPQVNIGSHYLDQTTKNATPVDGVESGPPEIKPSGNRKYVCSFCPRSFKTSQQRGLHTRLHTAVKRYPCVQCGQNFTRKDNLRRHSPVCSKVLCDRCGGFFLESQLEYHKKTCTSRQTTSTNSQSPKTTPKTPPRGFSCAYCSSKFLLFSQLQEHFLSMHKLENMNQPVSAAPLQQLLSNIPKMKEEPLNEHCEERVNTNGNLVCKPTTTVTKEPLKSLICQICNMSFINKAGLSGHQRVHTTEYPFTCKVCCKGFWSENMFRKHTRKCKSSVFQQTEGPLKAKIDFAFIDSKPGGKEQNKINPAALHTPSVFFNVKEEEEETSVQSYKGDQISSNSKKKIEQYQCSECDKSFTDGLLLISHLEDHGREEQEKKRYACSKCGKVCSNQANLEKHMRFHRTTLKYSCNQCSRVFPTPSELEKHKASHLSNKSYCCKLCQRRFLTRLAFSEHYTTQHADAAFHCPFCSKIYATKKSLSRHVKDLHRKEWKDFPHTMAEKSKNEQQASSHLSTTGESDENEIYGSDSDSDSAPYFPCHVCGKTFPTSENLEDHQLCHLGEKPHECGECGKCFFLASQLQQHQRMHKSEFQCQTCGRGFVTHFALRTHKHTHGKNRPHRCPKCHLSFTGPTHLAEHMSTHREENFPCDICNQVFQSKSCRAEHRKTHSKAGDYHSPLVPSEEPESFSFAKQFKYRCGVCGERFRDPEELSEHGCLKATERPYSCINCNKHFLHTSHLKKHICSNQSPWSNREYPCNQCNSSFSSSQNFLQHLKSHVLLATGIEDMEVSDSFICPVCHQCFASALELIVHFPTHPDFTSKQEITNQYHSESEPTQHKKQRLTSDEFDNTNSDESFLHADASQPHEDFREQQIPAESKNSNLLAHGAAGEEEDVDVMGEDFFTCSDCKRHFSSKSAYLEHLNKQHANKRLFECNRCGKSFAKMRYLKKHESRHRLKDSNDISFHSVETKFKCSQCPSKFYTPEELTSHLRLHAEEQAGDFRCDMCYKSFSQRALLKQHQESHVGEVVYECTDCDKAFAFPHLLEEHQQTHAGSSQ